MFVYISRKKRQYPYRPEYQRATKTVPYTTNGDNNHSTKVHKNSYIRFVRYTIAALDHPIPTTEITVSFYGQILRKGISTQAEDGAHTS